MLHWNCVTIQLQILPIENTGLKEAFNVHIKEYKPLDFKFLHGFQSPTFCLLSEDSKGVRRLKLYSVDVNEKDISEVEWSNAQVDNNAQVLIPVPLPYGGVIVISASSVTYINGNSNVRCAVAIQESHVTAFTQITDHENRFLFGNQQGELFLLVFKPNQTKKQVESLVVEPLGVTSIPEQLCYIKEGIIFVGSALGDSQLVRLLPALDVNTKSYVEVIDVYANTGPILDMCYVEGDDRGRQSQVHTYIHTPFTSLSGLKYLIYVLLPV